MDKVAPRTSPYAVWIGKKTVRSIVEEVGSSTAVTFRVKEPQLTLSPASKGVSEPTIAMFGPRLVRPCPPAFSQGRTVKSVLGAKPTRATIRPDVLSGPTKTCGITLDKRGAAEMPRHTGPVSA